MMGNQKLVEKFVRKFLDDPTYEQIKEAVNKMDYDEILRTTHTAAYIFITFINTVIKLLNIHYFSSIQIIFE